MRALKPSRWMVILALTFALTGAGGVGAASGQTVVSLGFDDGYTSQYDVGPLLASHGMHATFFMISGNVGDSGFMTWSQLAELEADGNEIGGHTVDHVDLTTVSAAVARQQVCDDRAQLQAHGLNITNFAYPYGNADAQAEQAVEDCGYDSARTTGWYGFTCPFPCTESIPPRDPFATTVVGFSDQTLPELQTVVTNAEVAGGWAQIVIHQVCDGGCAISPATLDAFLDWLATRVASGAIAVRTVREVMSGPPPPPPVPETSIMAGPSGVTNHASPSFSFTSDVPSGVTFACRLDGPGAANGSWGGCTSPKGYASLAEGGYTFRVRATTAAGTDQTPASRSFTVDTLAPGAPVIGAPGDDSWNASGTVVLSGTAEAGGTVELFDGVASMGIASVDGSGAWSRSLSGVPDGSHVYTARASDAAGNTSGASASRTVKVDTVAPAAPVIGSPADDSWNSSGTVVLSGTAEAGSTVEVLEGESSTGTTVASGAGSWSTTLGGVPDGSHVFKARASDAAGNTSGSSASRTVKVDTVAPDTVLTSGPSGTTALTSAVLVFAGAPDGGSFECALDGAPFAACTPPVALSSLASGSHSFEVRAYDEAGNVDGSPASRMWSVDPPAPPTDTTAGVPPVSPLPVAPLAAPLVPGVASASGPQIEVLRAPAVSPVDLVGSLYSWGVRTRRGDRLPAGASLVRARVTFAAGTSAGTVIPVTLACPSGQRLVDLADLRAPRPLGLESYTVRFDRATQVSVRFSAREAVSVTTTARAGALCFAANRLTALRAQQERAAVRRAALTRPEVRSAPRRELCRDSYVQQRPGRLVIGNVAKGDPVRVLRRSASGQWTEILGLRAFDGTGWIRTQLLCR